MGQLAESCHCPVALPFHSFRNIKRLFALIVLKIIKPAFFLFIFNPSLLSQRYSQKYFLCHVSCAWYLQIFIRITEDFQIPRWRTGLGKIKHFIDMSSVELLDLKLILILPIWNNYPLIIQVSTCLLSVYDTWKDGNNSKSGSEKRNAS